MTEKSANTTKHPVSIDVLGRPYTILCTREEEEILTRSAEELDQRIRRIQSGLNPVQQQRDRIIVTVALNLARDLLHQASETENRNQSLQGKIDSLASGIELTLQQNADNS